MPLLNDPLVGISLDLKVAMSFGLKTNELEELFAVENTSGWIDCADFRGALAKVLNCIQTEIMNRFFL